MATPTVKSQRAMLGSRIRALRMKMGYTQKEFARLAGINLGNFGKLERGQANASFDLLVTIAQALGVSCRELMDFEHAKDHTEVRQNIDALLNGASEDEIRMALRFLNIVIH